MAKTTSKTQSALAEAGPVGNTPAEIARLAEINQRLADLAADPAIAEEQALRQALVDEDTALRQLAHERYHAADFSFSAWTSNLEPAQAKRFFNEVESIGAMTTEESLRLEALRTELDRFPLPSELARKAEVRALNDERQAIQAAPAKRASEQAAQQALDSAREMFSQAAQQMRAIEDDMAGMLKRLAEVKRLSSIGRLAEEKGKQLARKTGFVLSHLPFDGVRQFDDVEATRLLETTAKAVLEGPRKFAGPKTERKSTILDNKAARCTLHWTKPQINEEHFDNE